MEDKYQPFYTNDLNLPKLNQPNQPEVGVKKDLGADIKDIKKPEDLQKVKVNKFVKEVKENPLLREYGVSVEKNALIKFYKIMTIVAIFSLIALVSSFSYLTFTDGFKPVFIDNSTLICEKPVIPACPPNPACNCNANITCPAFPDEIIIKDLEELLNKTA